MKKEKIFFPVCILCLILMSLFFYLKQHILVFICPPFFIALTLFLLFKDNEDELKLFSYRGREK